jgi:rubrerythrin
MMSLTLRSIVHRTFLRGLVATPRGRAYVFTQAALAESTDEGVIFERLSSKVDDLELQRIIRKHSDDETRHAALYFGCADRQGVGRPHVPEDSRVLDLLNAREPLFTKPIETREDVMDAYLLLQVIEERAVEQFSILEPVMREVDPRSADVLLGVTKDEERHLRYCHAVVRRYAPTEAHRVARLKHLRKEEAMAFAQHQAAGLAHLLRDKYLPAHMRVFWRALTALLSLRKELPYTRFQNDFGMEEMEAADRVATPTLAAA